ncbi:MAG: oligosaccharide flippase family protein [Lachnospiraceae bacterium]|nr:oligosaccharide flippase family protein [Lachnospiraceae bacterium]
MLSANVINKIVVMISNMVITRILTRSDFGMWGYILNIYSYASLIAGLGLDSGAFQFGAENKGKGEAYRYYKYCLNIGLIINIVIIAVFYFYIHITELVIENSGLYIKIYLPVLIIEYLINIFSIMLRCSNRIKTYAKITNINTVLIAVATCVGACWGVPGVIGGKYCARVLSLASIICVMRQDLKNLLTASMLELKQITELWNYTIFTGVSSAFNRSLYLIDVTMIAQLIRNTEEIAIYKVSTMIPHALMFIPSSIIMCFLPDIVGHNREKRWLKSNVKKLYFFSGMVNFSIAFILFIFSKVIILLISGDQYIEAVGLFRIHLVGFFLTGTFRDLSVNILAGLKKVHYNLFISAIQIVSEVVFNYLLIIKFGMYGAAYATVLVEIIAAAMATFYLHLSITKMQDTSFAEP